LTKPKLRAKRVHIDAMSQFRAFAAPKRLRPRRRARRTTRGSARSASRRPLHRIRECGGRWEVPNCLHSLRPLFRRRKANLAKRR